MKSPVFFRPSLTPSRVEFFLIKSRFIRFVKVFLFLVCVWVLIEGIVVVSACDQSAYRGGACLVCFDRLPCPPSSLTFRVWSRLMLSFRIRLRPFRFGGRHRLSQCLSCLWLIRFVFFPLFLFFFSSFFRVISFTSSGTGGRLVRAYETVLKVSVWSHA